MTKIMSQTHEMLNLKEQLYYYKTEFFRVVKENNWLNEIHKNKQKS